MRPDARRRKNRYCQFPRDPEFWDLAAMKKVHTTGIPGPHGSGTAGLK
jgi:hypothetical protein